jgi:hypothetical protein
VDESNLTPGVLEGTATRDVHALLKAPWKERVEVTVKRGDATADVAIGSCTDLLAEGHAIVDVKPASRWNEIRAVRVLCEALARLEKMKDAKREVLPFEARPLLAELASLNATVGPRGRGPVLAELGEATNVQCPSGSICTADAGSDSFAVSVLALGDYDGDGVADVMVAVTAGPTRGTLTWSAGFIITKKAAGSPCTVIEQW